VGRCKRTKRSGTSPDQKKGGGVFCHEREAVGSCGGVTPMGPARGGGERKAGGGSFSQVVDLEGCQTEWSFSG